MYTTKMFQILTAMVCLWGVYRQAEAINCHLREVDLCLATILISGADGVPSDEDDIDRSCEPIQEGIECIGNYTASCFTPLLKELYNMVTEEPFKMQKEFCTRGSESRAAYLKNAPCMQDVMSSENLRAQLDDVLATLEKAMKVKFQDRIPTLCCGVQRMGAAVSETVKQKCGEEVLAQGAGIMGINIGEMLGMVCKGYENGSPKCKDLLPPAGTPFNGADSDNQLIRFIASALSSFA